jgi:hypothetical protein
MKFSKKIKDQGFHYDADTGLTFSVAVSVSNDLKAQGMWCARGASSDSGEQHAIPNEVHM